MNELIIKLREFAAVRDWEKFHTPKNLVMALSGEVGELNEVMQWLSDDQVKRLMIEDPLKITDEIADVFLYLLRLSDILNIDLIKASHSKIDQNAQKYPVEKSKGIAKKYSEF